MMTAIRALQRQIAQIPPPADYYQGVATAEARMPFNILLFTRQHSSELYGQERSPSLHQRCVLIFNFQTKGALILDGRWLTLRPGDCALVLPHQIHAFADIQSPNMSWLFVTFDFSGAEAFEPLRHRILKIPPPCLEWLEAVITYWKSHPMRVPFLTGLILNELLEGAKKHVQSAAPPVNGLEQIVTRLHKILESEPGLRIKELARRINLSEPHLRAEFRHRTTLSLGHYLRQFRLNRAAVLLTSTSKSIGEIATLCGFESLYSFSRSFRTSVGMPPRTYRQSFLPSPAR